MIQYGAEPLSVAKNRVSSAVERDWALFVDWCLASGARPVPAGPALLRLFLAEVRCSPVVGRRRLKAIDSAHRALGFELPGEQLRSPPPARFDPGLVAATLGSISVGGWPAGIVGRRDAALVALICAGGLTRRQVGGLRAAPRQAPVLSPMSIRGRVRRVPCRDGFGYTPWRPPPAGGRPEAN
jgi:hypothetical protein